MKYLYTRPLWLSSKALLAVTALAVAGLVFVECLPRMHRTQDRSQMIKAAHLARRCMEAIKTARLERGIEINERFDPASSGIIGQWMTPVTSVYGNLHAKQTSINPNFAAAILQMLKQAGIEEGSIVAVAFSGSFPAINACVCAAIETLNCKPLIISSASASQWGANSPSYLWIDMESVLHKQKLIRFRSLAASLGGREDRAVGMSAEGIDMLKQAVKRNGLTLIEASSYEESVQKRLELYQNNATTVPITAYINVGGSTASVGTPEDKRSLSPGLTTAHPGNDMKLDSVMSSFLEADVPVIHLSQIQTLAREYGFPQRPSSIPDVGDGGLYQRLEYEGPVTAVVLIATCMVVLTAGFLSRRKTHIEAQQN